MRQKKPASNFESATDSSIEKYQTILIKFKIRISRLIAKILLKQRNLNQIRHRLAGYISMTFRIQIFHFYNCSEPK